MTSVVRRTTVRWRRGDAGEITVDQHRQVAKPALGHGLGVSWRSPTSGVHVSTSEVMIDDAGSVRIAATRAAMARDVTLGHDAAHRMAVLTRTDSS